MSDSVTVVETQGWFSRIGSALGGVFFGILLILIGLGLLFWNEGRAVKTAQSLDEGAASVQSVSADAVDPGREGKLVHLSGIVKTEATLSDPDFGISAPALLLERNVEMYQWRENEETKEEKKLGGSVEKTTIYTYEKVWSSSPISSESFKNASEHRNPSKFAYDNAEWTASDATLGAFKFPGRLIESINAKEALKVDTGKFPVHSGGFYLGKDPGVPEIGDLKISFQVIKPVTVTVVAGQASSTFEPYPTEAGPTVELLEVGTKTAAEMFKSAHEGNAVLTWILRIVGFVLVFAGFSMVLKPLSVFADVIPFVGSIVGAGTALISFLLAIPVSLLTVAIAWFFFRPLLAIALIVVSGCAVALVIFLVKRRAAPIA